MMRLINMIVLFVGLISTAFGQSSLALKMEALEAQKAAHPCRLQTNRDRCIDALSDFYDMYGEHFLKERAKLSEASFLKGVGAGSLLSSAGIIWISQHMNRPTMPLDLAYEMADALHALVARQTLGEFYEFGKTVHVSAIPQSELKFATSGDFLQRVVTITNPRTGAAVQIPYEVNVYYKKGVWEITPASKLKWLEMDVGKIQKGKFIRTESYPVVSEIVELFPHIKVHRNVELGIKILKTLNFNFWEKFALFDWMKWMSHRGFQVTASLESYLRVLPSRLLYGSYSGGELIPFARKALAVKVSGALKIGLVIVGSGIMIYAQQSHLENDQFLVNLASECPLPASMAEAPVQRGCFGRYVHTHELTSKNLSLMYETMKDLLN